MKDEHVPKMIFYSQFKEGKRKKGGQKRRYKDALKANMKKCNIDLNNWETNAQDRNLWRNIIREGIEAFKSHRWAEEAKRKKRKERQQQSKPDLSTGTTCPKGASTFRRTIT